MSLIKGSSFYPNKDCLVTQSVRRKAWFSFPGLGVRAYDKPTPSFLLTLSSLCHPWKACFSLTKNNFKTCLAVVFLLDLKGLFFCRYMVSCPNPWPLFPGRFSWSLGLFLIAPVGYVLSKPWYVLVGTLVPGPLYPLP